MLSGFIIILATLFLFASIAEAKRFGGGGSFGSKRSYSSPFKKNTTQKKSFSQQKAASSNQQRKQQLSKKGGLMGMLGGLALGGLLGALFFGGAFENFNFFDFLIIGGIIFAVMWFMRRKKPAMQQARTANGFDYKTDNDSPSVDNTTAIQSDNKQKDADFTQSFTSAKSQKNDKEVSFAENFAMGNGSNDSHSEQSFSMANAGEIILPDWFNQEEFLSGSRSAYTLLQEAWDSGNLDEIKTLTTASVFAEIAQQHAQEASQGTTRILQLNAELIDFSESNGQAEAAVLFDALLGEADAQGSNERAAQVRELWHFVRKTESTEPTWYLDGIQQLDQ